MKKIILRLSYHNFLYLVTTNMMINNSSSSSSLQLTSLSSQKDNGAGGAPLSERKELNAQQSTTMVNQFVEGCNWLAPYVEEDNNVVLTHTFIGGQLLQRQGIFSNLHKVMSRNQ